MHYRTLGATDLQVSVVGLGGNTFGPPRLTLAQSIACIVRADELGINFVDTATRYGQGESEGHIGQALEGKRDKWVIATKFHLQGLAPGERVRDRVRIHCQTSLKRLRTDRIDLFQLHFAQPGVPVEEVWSALDELVRDGKVRYVGECNHAAWRHAELAALARSRGWPEPVSCQNHYNLLRRHVELETLPYCRERGVAFLPYFPLAGGFLSGKYQAGEPAPAGTRGAAGSPIVRDSRTPRNEVLHAQLKDWAHARGHSLDELAIAWLLAHPEVPCVITGVSTTAQVEANARAAEWVLSEDERAEVDVLARWDGSGAVTELRAP